MATSRKKFQPAPPRKRDWKSRQCYHVYQRGSRRQRVFQTRAQLLDYLACLDRLARRYRVRIHAFCLMSNHIHFLLEPLERWGISKLMQHLQSYYARAVHHSLGIDGHLWRNHFHAKHIKTASQYRATLLYIEQNPAAAGIARRAHRYDYSSAPAHCADQPLVHLQHRHRRVSLRLHLDRWRNEFPAPRDWPAWLRSPREPQHVEELAEIERVLGSDRHHLPRTFPLPLIEPRALAASVTQPVLYPLLR